MLTLNSRQLQEKLPAWLQARMAVLLVGPPGTGKTYTARKVSVQHFGETLVEVLDGGNESEWKGLFPYRTPSGDLELGKALRASGFSLVNIDGLTKTSSGGVLVIDEANRVPPELKSAFQLMASERIVPWPQGGTVRLDIAIVSTANESDLGVEEASRAELDRYDLVVRLSPAPEEMANIVAGEAGVRLEIAQAIYEAVVALSGKLDPKKFHLPEGLRLAISVARLLRTGTLGPADIFRGAAERCFPLGRRGAEKHRAEFDGSVAEVANQFAGKLANLGDISSPVTNQPQASPAPPLNGASAPATLKAVLADLANCTLSQVKYETFLPLPRPFPLVMHLFTQSFGMGVAKHLASKRLANAELADRAGVQVRFGKNGAQDAVRFLQADRHRVEKFCRACLEL